MEDFEKEDFKLDFDELDKDIKQQQKDLEGGRRKFNWLRTQDGTQYFRIVPDKNSKIAFASAGHFNVRIRVKNKDIPINCPQSTYFRGIRKKNEKKCPACEVYFSYLEQKKAARGNEKASWDKKAKVYNNSTKHNVLAIPWDPVEDKALGDIGILPLPYTVWNEINEIIKNPETFQSECLQILDKMVSSGELKSKSDIKTINRPKSIFGLEHGKVIGLRRWKESNFTKYKVVLSVSENPIDGKIIQEAPSLEEIFKEVFVDREYVHDYESLSYAVLTTMEANNHSFVDNKLEEKIKSAAAEYVRKREERESGNTEDEIDDIEAGISDIKTSSEDKRADEVKGAEDKEIEASSIDLDDEDDEEEEGTEDSEESSELPWA